MPENYHDELVEFCRRLRIASAMADRAETTEGETHIEFLYNLLKREIELRDQAHEHSLAVKPPFQNAGYRRSRNGVPLSCNFIRYHSA